MVQLDNSIKEETIDMLYIIFNIIFGIFIILLFRIFIYLGNYFKQSSIAKMKKTDQNLVSISAEPINLQPDINNTVDNTIAILDLCHSLIILEVSKLLEPSVRLNETYEYRRLDSDAKVIADNVFKALNKELLEKSEKAVTTEYILEYIASESILELMNQTQKHNVSLVE